MKANVYYLGTQIVHMFKQILREVLYGLDTLKLTCTPTPERISVLKEAQQFNICAPEATELVRG